MRERLRILYLVDQLDDPARETLAHLGRLVRNLDRALYDPTVVAVHGIAANFDHDCIPCHLAAAGISQSTPGWEVWRRAKLSRLIRTGHYDLACAYDLSARLLGLPVAKSAGIGVCIAGVRDLGHALTANHLMALRNANESAVRFVANSMAVATRLVRQERVRRDHVDIIPSGVDIPPLPPRTPQSVADSKHAFGLSVQERVVYMESPLERIKDHATFLAAAAYLVPLHPHVRFVLMAHGPEDTIAQFRARAAQAGVLDHLILVEDLLTRDQWRQTADVAVLTSMSEGCSETLLAYMAAGLPIVATSVGGNPELIRHGESGYLFEPGEADALAMRINILLLAEDLAAHFGAAARERARTEFSVENEVRRFADYYRALVFTSTGAKTEFYA